MKYLVDGANFVTSKMHFNPENNFYITLGLPESASQDEVRERWKRLMLLYHPDRQSGEEEWVSERAKKVNEAYSTLKDEAKRADYDRKMKAQVSQQRSVYHHQPMSGSVDQARRTRPRRSRVDDKDAFGRWQELRKYLPKMLVGLYVVGAAALLGFIYFQNNTSSLETELSSAGGHQPPQHQEQQPEKVMTPEKKSAEAPPEKPVLAKEEVVRQVERPASVPPAKPPKKRNELPVARSTEKGALQNVSLPVKPREKEYLAYAPSQKEPQRQQPEPPRPKETAEGYRADSRPAIASSDPPPPVPSANVLKPKAADTGSVENLHKTVPAAPIVQARGEQKANAEAPGEAKVQAPPAAAAGQITMGEVEDFIKRYSAAYEKGDISAFMIFFSPSAVENNVGYEGIRDIYRKTFSEKIGHYRLQNVDVKIAGDSAVVSAKYQVTRFLSARDQWVSHSGRILWKLSKMNHTLKIVSAQYGD